MYSLPFYGTHVKQVLLDAWNKDSTQIAQWRKVIVRIIRLKPTGSLFVKLWGQEPQQDSCVTEKGTGRLTTCVPSATGDYLICPSLNCWLPSWYWLLLHTLFSPNLRSLLPPKWNSQLGPTALTASLRVANSLLLRFRGLIHFMFVNSNCQEK